MKSGSTTALTPNDQFVKSFLSKQIKTNILRVKAPEVTWVAMDLELNQIKEKFILPPFERPASATHINRILISIMNNEFYDNIIRVIKQPGGRYMVIDGQHRLAALWKAHVLFHLERYDIVLGVYKDAEEIRTIYQKINSGKRLKIIEMMKAMDDGTMSFFNALRNHCAHESVKEHVTYFDALNAIVNSRREDVTNKGATINDLLEQINSVQPNELEQVIEFLDMMYSINRDTFSLAYTTKIFRLLYKSHVIHSLRVEELTKLIHLLQNNEAIQPTFKKDSLEEAWRYLSAHVSRMRNKA